MLSIISLIESSTLLELPLTGTDFRFPLGAQAIGSILYFVVSTGEHFQGHNNLPIILSAVILSFVVKTLPFKPLPSLMLRIFWKASRPMIELKNTIFRSTFISDVWVCFLKKRMPAGNSSRSISENRRGRGELKSKL